MYITIEHNKQSFEKVQKILIYNRAFAKKVGNLCNVST